jgi:hypothetical protein
MLPLEEKERGRERERERKRDLYINRKGVIFSILPMYCEDYYYLLMKRISIDTVVLRTDKFLGTSLGGEESRTL